MTISEELPHQGSLTKGSVANAKIQAHPTHVVGIVAPAMEEQGEKRKDHTWTCDEESDEGTTPVYDEPANSVPQLQRWNSPRINAFRTLATFWDFMILGASDAAYGALIPYLESYYGLDYLTVSLVFLAPIVGYVASALTNNAIHVRFGQRGIAFIVSLTHLIAYIAIALHPPYPVLAVIFMLAAFGNGLADSGFNAWIGDMANANEVLGFLHGFYGLGALLSPLIATAVITQAGWKWYEFYYFMIGASLLELFGLVGAFWKATGSVYRAQHASIHNDTVLQDAGPSTMTDSEENPDDQSLQVPWMQRFNPFHNNFLMNQPFSQKKGRKDRSGCMRKASQKVHLAKRIPGTTVEAVNNRVTVLSALFLLVYVGAEVSIGGWIVTFMLRVRGGTHFASGLTATGFWLGMTVGRFLLGFVTARLFPTEKHAVACYLTLCIVLQILFWLIPSFLVSAVMVAFIGFFLAPLFPAAVVAMTKLLPKRLHVAGIGFAAATGASGATVLPFAVGAIASKKGVTVLQPIILALLVVMTCIWLLLPQLPKRRMA